MQFRIISDLHVDINRDYVQFMKFDPNAFYLIAGDIAGGFDNVCDFVKENIKQGIFISGNHEGYDTDYNVIDQTKEYFQARLSKEFPLNNQVSFLENQYKELDEDIVVVGCTLYTDFELFQLVPFEESMNVAHYSMNDFRYVYTYDSLGDNRLVTPSDYRERFFTSLNFIEDVCLKFPDKKIIVVSHHAPSMKSIVGKYVRDKLSAAYASNLDNFIEQHENIKLWCHGHVHNTTQYKYRNRARVICNPFGYYNETNQNLSRYLGAKYTL